MGRKIEKDVLEERIEKAQEDVVKAKKKYDATTATLKQLLDKRQAMRVEEVMAAIAKSNRSYEDIVPEELERTIRVQKSMEILSAWLKLAAKVDSVEEFAKRIKN